MRFQPRDARYQPVTNLFTNPGFETGSGTVVVRTNLAPFPGGTTSTLTSGWTVTRGVVTNPGGYLHFVCNTAGAGVGGSGVTGATNVASMVPVAPGDVVAVSAEARGGTGVTSVVAGIQFYDSTPAFITGSQTLATATTVNSSGFVELTRATGTAPAGAAYARPVVFENKTSAVGDTFDVRTVTIEKTSVRRGAPFDGSAQSSPDADLSTRWTGTANGSSSELYGVAVAGLAANVGVAAIQSTRYTAAGTYSMRLIPISSATNVSYAQINFTGAGTVVITNHQEAALTGSLWTSRGQPYVTSPQINSASQLANAVGTLVHRISFSGGQTSLILPHGGFAGSGDVWYDLSTLVADVYYLGRAFTGDSTYAKWNGTANASTSIGYPYI